MKALSSALLLAVLTVVLGGCGQTGPLYLPGYAPESQTDGPFGMDDDAAQDSSKPSSADSSEATDNRVDTP